jgi:hypothetical protein
LTFYLGSLRYFSSDFFAYGYKYGNNDKNKAETLGAELYFLPGTAEVLEQRHFVFPAKIRELDMLDPAKSQNYSKDKIKN